MEDWDALDQTIANFRKWTPELFDVLKAKGFCSESLEDVVEMQKVGVYRPSWGVVQWTVLPKTGNKSTGDRGALFCGGYGQGRRLGI